MGSSALGAGNIVHGDNSSVFGRQSVATGVFSTAFGANAVIGQAVDGNRNPVVDANGYRVIATSASHGIAIGGGEKSVSAGAGFSW